MLLVNRHNVWACNDTRCNNGEKKNIYTSRATTNRREILWAVFLTSWCLIGVEINSVTVNNVVRNITKSRNPGDPPSLDYYYHYYYNILCAV